LHSKGEQLSLQLLSGIIDKFPEGLEILAGAASTTSSQIVIDPSLEGEKAGSTLALISFAKRSLP
jgi:hypothetical protein